ncbi:MAG TPA: Na+/glucose cotransporter, partial [Anseongella sp.]|nr:Na+/glucose cotransporter [Anseongella sp.]
ALYENTPADYWNLLLPGDNPDYPWPAILLGYPVMGIWFWCTDQSMVQPVLAAKNLRQGQTGANFTAWLKILDVPLFILPGILCFLLFPALENPDAAYMTMVTGLFPAGIVGLVLAALIAALISTLDSALNALGTVFTMDIYVRKYRPGASPATIVRTGRLVTVAGAAIAVFLALAIDGIRGLNLFDVFQSVLGFIAPPMSVVFLFGIAWKRTTARAANLILTAGTAFSLLTGILYLWVFPAGSHAFWPHFLLLSFFIFTALALLAFLVSYFDRQGAGQEGNTLDYRSPPKLSVPVRAVWIGLALVMAGLYLFFNGH